MQRMVLRGDQVVLHALPRCVRDGKRPRERLTKPYQEGSLRLSRQRHVDVVLAREPVHEALPPQPQDGPLVPDGVERRAVPLPERVKLTLIDHRLSPKELFVEVHEVEFRERSVRPCGLRLLCGAEEVRLERVCELGPGDLVLVEEGVPLEHGAGRALPLVLVRDHDERCGELALEGDGDAVLHQDLQGEPEGDRRVLCAVEEVQREARDQRGRVNVDGEWLDELVRGQGARRLVRVADHLHPHLRRDGHDLRGQAERHQPHDDAVLLPQLLPLPQDEGERLPLDHKCGTHLGAHAPSTGATRLGRYGHTPGC